MASPDRESAVSFAEQTSRHLSPPPAGLRQRPLGRSSTFAEPSLQRRRSSIFSETLSDAKRSFKSSTDDLFIPGTTQSHDNDDDSHWQSSSIGLALLPAVGGIFFKGGDKVLGDISLLIIAAIFMNWSLRIPWKWYRSAQTVISLEPRSAGPSTPVIDEEDEDMLGTSLDDVSRVNESTQKADGRGSPRRLLRRSSSRDAAETELRMHELMALVSCFICPGLAAWMLHGIRSQLSRPSEGLVSNFNLTLFLMAAEIRPMSHLIKLIQKRTLFLQRKINIESLRDPTSHATEPSHDLIRRIEELEAHIANGIATRESQPADDVTIDHAAAKASALALADIRKVHQPELEALGRAMRRYEKKSTIAAVQIEGRLQELEVKYADVVVLAASAQRSVQNEPRLYHLILLNWICAAIVIPVEMAQAVLFLPKKMYLQVVSRLARMIPGFAQSKGKGKEREISGKPVRRSSKMPGEKRLKSSS